MGAFYKQLCKSDNLHAAWRHVRKSALASSMAEIPDAAKDFDVAAHSELRSIQSRLSRKSYKFGASKGVLKDKKKREAQGKAPRPLVLGTLEARVVHRAILQVLQPKPESPLYGQLGKIRSVNESPFGIGGLPKPYGGVQVAVGHVLRSIEDGYSHFFKSDIQAFFTKIPHSSVVDFVRSETNDIDLADLFMAGLTVEIENKDQLRGYFSLFPQGGVGVPQGSSLSAFAGNILLHEFDRTLNDGETRAYRYIDDLIILGKSNEATQRCRSKAIKALKKFGMTLYTPSDGATKCEEGVVKKGFTFLGCQVSPKKLEPAKAAQSNLLEKVRNEVGDAKKAVEKFLSNAELTRHSEKTFVQTLNHIDRVVYGWAKSYSFCNNRLPFIILDKKILSEIQTFKDWFENKTLSTQATPYRRALGVALLQDVDSSYEQMMTNAQNLSQR
jgi:retron-type reverse transcriptase